MDNMENNKGFRVMSVVALAVAVVGLSLGFAAFTTSLTINANATVTPSGSTFSGRVYFANSGATAEDTEPAVVNYTGTNATATTDESGTTLTISATFANVDSSSKTATVTATILNDSPFTANLSSVSLGTPQCTTLTEGSAVRSACEALTIESSVSVETGLTIASGATAPVTFTITYPAGYPVDSNFNATFSATTLGFTSAG